MGPPLLLIWFGTVAARVAIYAGKLMVEREYDRWERRLEAETRRLWRRVFVARSEPSAAQPIAPSAVSAPAPTAQPGINARRPPARATASRGAASALVPEPFLAAELQRWSDEWRADLVANIGRVVTAPLRELLAEIAERASAPLRESMAQIGERAFAPTAASLRVRGNVVLGVTGGGLSAAGVLRLTGSAAL